MSGNTWALTVAKKKKNTCTKVIGVSSVFSVWSVQFALLVGLVTNHRCSLNVRLRNQGANKDLKQGATTRQIGAFG